MATNAQIINVRDFVDTKAKAEIDRLRVLTSDQQEQAPLARLLELLEVGDRLTSLASRTP